MRIMFTFMAICERCGQAEDIPVPYDIYVGAAAGDLAEQYGWLCDDRFVLCPECAGE